MKSYQQVIHDTYSLQEDFTAWVQEMEEIGLSEQEIIKAVAEDFAQVYLKTEQRFSPEDALVEYCRYQGITENLYEAVVKFIAEGTENDNLTTDFIRLSPQQHQVAVRRFLRRLSGTAPAPNKTFLDTHPNNPSPAAKTRLPDRRKPNEEDEPGNRLKGVMEAREESHKLHPLYSVLKSHGYEHSRSYPILQSDRTMKKYHVFFNRHNNVVGTYEAPNTAWTSKVNQHSGHQVQGVGKIQLDAHLKSRNARNKSNEQLSLPATPLQEGLQNPEGKSKADAYARWMKQNPIRSLDHQIGSENNQSNARNDLMTAWKMKADHDRQFGFDEEANNLHGKTHSSYWGKK